MSWGLDLSCAVSLQIEFRENRSESCGKTQI